MAVVRARGIVVGKKTDSIVWPDRHHIFYSLQVRFKNPETRETEIVEIGCVHGDYLRYSKNDSIKIRYKTGKFLWIFDDNGWEIDS